MQAVGDVDKLSRQREKALVLLDFQPGMTNDQCDSRQETTKIAVSCDVVKLPATGCTNKAKQDQMR
jgi:hypothetical protein